MVQIHPGSIETYTNRVLTLLTEQLEIVEALMVQLQRDFVNSDCRGRNGTRHGDLVEVGCIHSEEIFDGKVEGHWNVVAPSDSGQGAIITTGYLIRRVLLQQNAVGVRRAFVFHVLIFTILISLHFISRLKLACRPVSLTPHLSVARVILTLSECLSSTTAILFRAGVCKGIRLFVGKHGHSQLIILLEFGLRVERLTLKLLERVVDRVM